MLFDKTQIAEMYEKTYSKVYNYFYYTTLSKERAEDLTSRTYIRFLEKFHLYDPERKMVVEKLMSCLTERERSIVGMRYKMELPYKQIADITGTTEKNVSVILSRSLQKMRTVLED